MNRTIPWVCLVALASSTSSVFADDAIDAYRKGQYNKAYEALVKQSKLSGVESDYLGEMYLYGYGALKNNQLAIQHLTKAASLGFLPAQKMMARYELIYQKNPAEALTWFKKAADAGDLKAQLYCAAAYHFGVGVNKNEDKARYYDILAAKAGNSLAQASLAEHFLDSRHTENKRLGMIWLNRAVEQKEPLAQFIMAEVYSEGKLAPKDLDAAKSLYESALAGGYLPAMQGLANLAKLQNDEASQKAWEEKYQEAMKNIPDLPEVHAAMWLTRGKFKSFSNCGYDLSGILTSWEDKQALEQNRYNQSPQMAGISRKALYKPRFEMVKPAEVPLTDYYDMLAKTPVQETSAGENSGQGLNIQTLNAPQYELVEKKFTNLLVERAALGDPTAQFALGQLYERGEGGADKDLAKAVDYYMQAVAQQDLQAEYTLGIFYLKGIDGKPDYRQAVGWLSDAAFKGNPEAQYILGRIYEKGIQDEQGNFVIEPNYPRAKSMYALAAFNQSPHGEYHLAELLVRDKTGGLSVQETQKRHALMKRLYQDAASKGIQAAVLPLAFFDAMENDKTKQEKALEVAKKEAKSGNKKAALLYAILLDRGIGTSPDIGEAVYWYEQVPQSPVSEFVLGTYYATGNGVGKNEEKAQELLGKSASSGFGFAHFNLAILEHDKEMPFTDHLEQAHALGNSRASLLLADNALTQAEDESNLKAAREIYSNLAERGDKDAQVKLGYLLEQGLGGTKDYVKAAYWYELSANQGQHVAQYLLGRLNQMGRLSPLPDYQFAKKWYTQAMQHYAPAAIALGFIYETVDNNYKGAETAYKLAVAKDNKIGQLNLGLIYQYGKGMPQDKKQAEDLYQKAAEQGYSQAMVQLGDIYLHDSGFRHEKTAFDWYQKAADKGERTALYHLGVMTQNGQGTSKNAQEALNYYELAAQKGDERAVLALAKLHELGQGTAKNLEKAASLYQSLAENGNGYAQYQLAMLYASGGLGENQADKAKHWLKAASEHGCSKALHRLQWMNAQTSEGISFIEPLSLGVASAWNQKQ